MYSVYVSVYACMCTYVCMYVLVCMCMYVYMGGCACVYVCKVCVYVCMYLHLWVALVFCLLSLLPNDSLLDIWFLSLGKNWISSILAMELWKLPFCCSRGFFRENSAVHQSWSIVVSLFNFLFSGCVSEPEFDVPARYAIFWSVIWLLRGVISQHQGDFVDGLWAVMVWHTFLLCPRHLLLPPYSIIVARCVFVCVCVCQIHLNISLVPYCIDLKIWFIFLLFSAFQLQQNLC